MANLIIYDGECIFCQNYVRFVKLRENIGPVELLDARSDDLRVDHYIRAGYDLDEGMLFVRDGEIFYGAEAVNVLARLSSDLTLGSRLNSAMLSNRKIARMAYPFLKAGRRLTLFLRRKTSIRSQRETGNTSLTKSQGHKRGSDAR